MNILPKARTKNIVTQHLNDEVMIYDLEIHKAYNLNPTSSIIFNACDGRMRVDDLKKRHNYSDDLIYLALDELKKHNLLAADAVYDSPFAGMSRREVIRKAALSAAALPVIAALVAPTAAQSLSTCTPSGSSYTVPFTGNDILDCNVRNPSQCCPGSNVFYSYGDTEEGLATCGCS